ncbi:MAG: S-layer homology domain-containing protein [Firmicutes bacterium]|nr:S-layer homology domain-containing protein [Bacillota bacterium]
MKALNKTLVFVLVISFIFAFYFPLPEGIFAASMSINIYVENYKDGTLNIKWDALPQAETVRISYHSPLSLNPDKLETFVLPHVSNEAEITGLINDVIYDIDLIVYNNMGIEIGRGFLYFLPGITFQAKILNQTYRDIEGGGREIGIDPGVNLKWAVPKVWDGDKFDFSHNALSYMEEQIENVYNDGREISKLNYRINISTDSSKLDGSSLQAAVIIDYDCDNEEYLAYVSGNELLKSKVRCMDANGFMNFDLIGRKDNEAELPQPLEYQLPHAGILPGTVYYMNIKPVFQDSNNSPVRVVTVGAPEAMNGSPLLGPVSYVFTPTRFQITKDDMNNIYIKIYRINQGSLDLPRLYYEVQSIDDPTVSGDWVVKRRIDDTYFSGGIAVTVISGVNPDNEFFYKIVVKSDNVDDRLESSKMPYTLVKDKSRPPVPVNISIIERLYSPGMVIYPVTGEEVLVKSTDVTICWDKPEDWELIKDDLYFHIMLSTNQTDLDKDVELYADGINWGSYRVKYRLVKYISAKSPNIKEIGSRLSYTIKGFELFRGEGDDGVADELIDNPDNYPHFLLPNRVYYIQMYTTRAVDAGAQEPSKTSDKSLVKSFTTLSGIERDVPSPANVKVNKNEIDKDTKQNVIELQFDKVNIDWNLYTDNSDTEKAVYYDLYMSTRTEADSFICIGTTQYLDRDVIFRGIDDPGSSYIRATVSSFRKDVNKYIPDNDSDYIDPYEVFGAGLRPNTVYYFVLRTRLAIEGQPRDRESSPTPVLAVTTPRTDISEPDETARRPLAPSDFSIALDKEGNPEVSGSRVTFSWTLLEQGVSYRLICTSERVEPDADSSAYENDPVYRSFIAHFGNKDSDGDKNTYTLNPEKDLKEGVFEYDNITKTYKLTIDEWLFPNSLYYFSIKAQIEGKESVWVSIPVTTAIIEMPDLLEPIYDSEIGFFWYEYNSNIKAEDYKIYLKGPKDNDYKQVNKSDIILIKDGMVFYARIRNLEPDSAYSIKVYRGENNSILTYEKENIYTRQACYEIEVKWRGTEGYEYEIAVRTEDDEDYITVNDAGLEHFKDRYERTLPYYVEKTSQTTGTDKSFYYARIKSIPRTSSNGQVIQSPLEPNTKYYVKVRALKVDPLDNTLVAYSKYIGPVFLRTEFSQGDYDRKEEEEKRRAVFEDKIEEFENALYWEINTWNSSEYVVLLKGDRIANYIANSRDSSVLLDLGDMPYGVNTNIMYVPENVVNVLKQENKELKINIAGISCSFRPGTLYVLETMEVKKLKDNQGVKETFIELKIALKNGPIAGLPSNTKPVSPVVEFGIKAFGTSKTYDELKNMIENRLYNSETGLVKEKTTFIVDYYGRAISDDKIEEYMEGLIRQMEKELSLFIQNTLQWMKVKNAETNINSFGSSLSIKLPVDYNSQGLNVPYVKYMGNEKWSKVSQNVNHYETFVAFNVVAPGEYVLLGEKQEYKDIPGDYPDKGHILDFISKYDVAGIFNLSGGYFYPERSVSVKEAVLLYELVMGRTGEGTALDIKEKVKRLGLEGIINAGAPARDITRQETAGLIMKMYSVKAGVDYDRLRPVNYVFIEDEGDINDKYYKAVVILVENGIMKLDDRRCFGPGKHITRGEMLAAMDKIINN